MPPLSQSVPQQKCIQCPFQSPSQAKGLPSHCHVDCFDQNKDFDGCHQVRLKSKCYGRRWKASLSGVALLALTAPNTRLSFTNMLKASTLSPKVTPVPTAVNFAPPEMRSDVTYLASTILPRRTFSPTRDKTDPFLYPLHAAAVEAKMLKEVTESGVMWRCVDCGHQTKFRTSLFEHCESKHIIESSGYLCQYCQKFCRTRNALRSHVNRQHSLKYTL